MAQFSVKPDNVKATVNEESKLIRELNSLEDSIRVVSNQLGFRVAAKANIRSRLNNAADRVSGHRRGMSSMHSALQNVIGEYTRTENAIMGNANVGNAAISDAAGIGYVGSHYEEGVLKKFADYISDFFDTIDKSEYRDYICKRIEDINDFFNKLTNYDPGTLGLLLTIPDIIPADIDKFNAFVDNIKETIYEKTSFDAEAKRSGTLYQDQISSDHGSLGVSALAAEAYADADGGLMSRDEDGNLIVNPHIDAKVGASATAIEASGAYAVGNEWAGADVGGNITAGQVSGEAQVSGGFMDEDGSFNPHAKVGASAEAIVIDAHAQAGATVLGTRAEVQGGVNVGFGAHAKVEVGDGKIACDVGASLGLGASLSFSVDYSGTVKAAKKVVKGMAEGIKKKLKWW